MTGKTPIKTAIVGLGRAGYNIHVSQFRNRDDYRIVAVADLNDERCQEVADECGCATFSSLDSLLASSDAELVVVATPSIDHAPHGIAALQAGRHAVLEKPFAVSLEQADALLAAQAATGRMLTVHQSRRWAADFVFIRNMLADERLGKVFFIRVGSYGFGQRNDWQTLTKFGGGSLNNSGVHPMDQLYLLLDSEPVSVWGDMQKILSAGDAEDHCKIVVRGANGRVVELELSSGCAVPLPNWVVLGSRGALVVQAGKATLRYAKEIPELPEPDGEPIVLSRSYGVQGDVPAIEFIEEELEPKADPGPGFYDLVYSALREGGTPPVDPRQCRAVLEIMMRARKDTPFPG